VTKPAPLPRLPARKLLLATLWLLLVGYTSFFAPTGAPSATVTLIVDAILLRTDRVDAGVIAVFNLLGIWPLLYAALLLAEGSGRTLKAWPFVLGSCFLGAFALLPYLALREDDGRFLGTHSGLVRFFEMRLVGIILFSITLTLVIFGLSRGEQSGYLTLFSVEPFVHIMSLDFLVLCSVFPSVLAADMERRGMTDARLFWLITAVPLLGPAFYIAFRPALARLPT